MNFKIEASETYPDLYRVYIDDMVLRFNEKDIAYTFDKFCYIVFFELKYYIENGGAFLNEHQKELKRLQKELRKWVKNRVFA